MILCQKTINPRVWYTSNKDIKCNITVNRLDNVDPDMANSYSNNLDR